MKPKLKKLLINAIKIAVSLSLIIWVVSKLDLSHIKDIFLQADGFYMFLAIVAFVISQILSVFRFNLFIRKIGIRISLWLNSQLYLLGMFYNYFLPGGIGGDAYKVYLLHKAYGKSVKKLSQSVFIDRFLGVLAIGFLFCVLGFFIPIPQFETWKNLICTLGIIFTFVALRLVIRFLFFYKKRIYIGFLYSVLVQTFQLISVYFIMRSFGIESDFLIYLAVFLISSILSIFSFAGIGVREAVFMYAAQLLNFDATISTSVAFAFSIIGLIISFLGIYFIFKKINFKK